VALSAAHACRQLSGVEPELKWPNDLMVKQWKLAGILAESTIGSDGIAVVVGLGLNVNWPQDLPPELATTAVALNYLSQSVPTPAEVLSALLIDLDVRIRDWEQVGADYRSRCSTVGRKVSVDLGSEQFIGEVVGLDASGRLEVRPDDGGETRAIAAADVVHLRAS
jgi:BirA family biotin operon repressor/biotin-[acetyl-CoA-carboxylase] ligase